jgi:hypothetical protein
MSNSVASWAYWEKNKYRAFVALAIFASGAIAAAPSNERRMFAFPAEPMVFSAVPQPQPVARFGPVAAYLADGCEPELERAEASFERVIEEADCGEGRKREPAPAFVPEPEPEPEPAAFFAMPDVPILIDEIEIPQIPELTPPAQRIAFLSRGGLSAPSRSASLAPPILVVPGVPEPGSWLLMILGLGCAGALLRRSRLAADRAVAARE